MIARTAAQSPTPAWRRELRAAVASVDELLELVGVERSEIPGGVGDGEGFAMRVPRPFVSRMRVGDPRDPLLLQVIATGSEAVSPEGYGADPLDESSSTPVAGVLHKYAGRALVVTTGACAVNCRYCFRRHFPYGEHATSGSAWSEALRYVANDSSVREVVLSGGDPLVVDDERLATFVDRMGAIPHLDRLRIHTRVPVVLPSRVDDRLLAWIEATRLDVVVVLHVNHAREIDDEVASAVERFRGVGAVLLNQSVLLRGVNDTVDDLVRLSERLVSIGVVPYYLHQLDRVAGAAHFEVSDDRAVALERAMRARVSGYLVPRWVREVPGAESKVELRELVD